MTYEVSEWQNPWYTNVIFLNGMTTYGIVDGNWGADERQPNSGEGARSLMLRVGWEPSFGGYPEERVRTLVNQEYYAVGEQRAYSHGVPYPYHHYVDFTLRYSRPWNAAVVGGELLTGQDVYGQRFSRLSAFVRYGGDVRTRQDEFSSDPDNQVGDETGIVGGVHGLESLVDVGVNASVVHANLEEKAPIESTKTGINPHVAIGARRAVSASNDLGVRLEVDEVHGHNLISFRAVDYRYRFDTPRIGLVCRRGSLQSRDARLFDLLRRGRAVA